MNIIEATKHLKEGKKIKRKYWVDIYIIYCPGLKGDLIIWSSGKNPVEFDRFMFDTNDLLADDWEAVEG